MAAKTHGRKRSRAANSAQAALPTKTARGAKGGQLVVLSNRLPITLRRARGGLHIEKSSGGLVAALEPAMRQQGGAWVGWPGASLRAGETLPPPKGGADSFRLSPVELSATEVRCYYHGFSNRALWPLFHSLPGRAEFHRSDWQHYETVNRRFAEAACEVSGEADLLWIHDYHLLRAAWHLRRLRPGARIAFFLHIPFPSFDIYRILPWYRELLRGLLACDLVGFHCADYAKNFLDCVQRLLGERVDHNALQVEHGHRTVQAGAFPLGIDYAAQEQLARAQRPAAQRGERLILGVDRLDYTKGIPERIRAFERLLEMHPEFREQVVLLQIAVPSRKQVTEYQALKREIDELVGRVNGRFGRSDWTPIRYLYRSIAPDRLAALYRDADIALVTPLRDGMNLVAKEFVASQVAEPGVLVLSRMAGTAETMHESLRVNPYNADSVAENLQRALQMSREDRLARIRALQRRERANDLSAWLRDFLGAARRERAVLQPVSSADFEEWLGAFLQDFRTALFLDYDGTLCEISSHPARARLRPAARRALAACAARSDTDVAIVSGRALADLRRIVGLEAISYAGNHGIEIEGPGLKPFAHPDSTHFCQRAAELARALGGIRVPGVWVEEKGASLTLHYREADPARGEAVAAEARAQISAAGFQPRDAHCAVEARPPIGWDKGHAVLHLLRARHGPAWSERLRVIYVGDDETDEDAFRALQGLGATFRVGRADEPSLALRRLRDVGAVETLLRWLAARPVTAARGARRRRVG